MEFQTLFSILLEVIGAAGTTIQSGEFIRGLLMRFLFDKDKKRNLKDISDGQRYRKPASLLHDTLIFSVNIYRICNNTVYRIFNKTVNI